jgi:hypothetical protein
MYLTSCYRIILVGTFNSLPNFALAILFSIAMYILREGLHLRIVWWISSKLIWIYLWLVYILFQFRMRLVFILVKSPDWVWAISTVIHIQLQHHSARLAWNMYLGKKYLPINICPEYWCFSIRLFLYIIWKVINCMDVCDTSVIQLKQHCI